MNWDRIFEGLKNRPRELFAAAVLSSGVGMITAGVNPWIAAGFPGTIYLLYGLKGLTDNMHRRKMAEIAVQKIEAERGKLIEQKARRALEKRRGKDGNR